MAITTLRNNADAIRDQFGHDAYTGTLPKHCWSEAQDLVHRYDTASSHREQRVIADAMITLQNGRLRAAA